jgi:hypothetical protein
VEFKVLEEESGEGGLGMEICSSYYLHMQKVVYMMGAYFAIAVEMQEI